MRVRILPSATDSSDRQFLTTFLLNGTVAVDAGCLGLYGTPADQANISGVVLTHSHADHVCSLPTFAMNVMDSSGRSTVVWSHDSVLQSLREDIFNGRVWPDFLTLVPEGEPIVQLRPIRPREPFVIDGLTFTAVPVNHPVPTMGYFIEDESSVIVISTDSGPTDELWARARATRKLTTMFVGVAFPDECALLAEVSGHLTPRTLREQILGLPESIRIVVVHIKPARRDEVVAQLAGTFTVEIGSSATVYDSCVAARIARSPLVTL
jgi:ribonuclease BN (tRNA processing enzyme)